MQLVERGRLGALVCRQMPDVINQSGEERPNLISWPFAARDSPKRPDCLLSVPAVFDELRQRGERLGLMTFNESNGFDGRAAEIFVLVI